MQKNLSNKYSPGSNLLSNCCRLLLSVWLLVIVLSASTSWAVPLPDPLPKQTEGQGLIETIDIAPTPKQYLPEDPDEVMASRFPAKDILLVFGASKNSQENYYFVMLQEYVNALQRSYSITVTHQPGRGGSYAPNALLQKNTDGYSLAAVTLPAFLWQLRLPDRLYTAEDISVLGIGAKVPLALWVTEDAPWQTLQDLIDAIHLMPVGSAFFCGTGSYSSHHMAHLVFGRAAGVSVEYLPLVGDVEGVRTVRSGQAMAVWGLGVPVAGMRGMRPLAVSSEDRRQVFSEIPTFKESGYAVVCWQYFGLAISGHTPDVLQEKVRQFAAGVLSAPEFVARVKSAGFDPLDSGGTDAILAEQNKLLDAFLEEYSTLLP